MTYAYNRQGQRTKLTDQNESVHEHLYDKLSRQTMDKVATLGSGVNGFVRRIEWTYDNRKRLHHVKSFSATSGGSVRSDVEYLYNLFSQVTTERQQHGAATSGTSPKVRYAYVDGTGNTVRRISCRYPDARAINYDYGPSGGMNDKLSRVGKIKLGLGCSTSRWIRGQMKKVRLGKADLLSPTSRLKKSHLSAIVYA